MSCIIYGEELHIFVSQFWVHAMLVHGLPDGQMQHPQDGNILHCCSAKLPLSFVLVVPLAISRPYFPQTSHSCELLILPKSLSHQEGQGRSKKVLCQIVTQEKSECAHALFLYWASLFSLLIPTTHPQLCIWDSHMTHGRSNKMIHPSRKKTCARCFTNQKITWAVQSRQSCVPTAETSLRSQSRLKAIKQTVF